MKKRQFALVATIMIALITTILVMPNGKNADVNTAGNPRIYPAATEGQEIVYAFEHNVTYTIDRHRFHDNLYMAACISKPGGMTVWSPIQDLIDAPDGTSFTLQEGKTWKESFQVIKLGS